MSSFLYKQDPRNPVQAMRHADASAIWDLSLRPARPTEQQFKTPSEPYLEPGVYYDPEEERAFMKETTTSPAAVGALGQSTQIPSTAAAGALGQSAQIPTPTLAPVNPALVFAFFKALIKYAL